MYLQTGTNGKGGDIGGAFWIINTNGLGGGGAGDSSGQFCYICLIILLTISIGNHMISSAIWDKSARVNFSLKNLRMRIYPKLHEKIM